MTVHKNIYSTAVPESNIWGLGFIRMFMVWKGSALKLIWKDLLMFLLCFFTLSLLYKFVFLNTPAYRDAFEMICIYSNRFSKYIPVTFMTGFYVANVVTRYWNQFVSIAWPDKVAFKIIAFIPGKDDYRRKLRRTIVRYMNLSTLLVFRLVSSQVKERFPDYESLVRAGILLPHEVEMLDEMDAMTPYDTTWVPLLWINELLAQERISGRLAIEPPIFANLINSFDYLENCNRSILNYAWVNIPLAYTQVATLSVYGYMFLSLFARQFLEPRGTSYNNDLFTSVNVTFSGGNPYMDHTPGLFIPFITIIEFICYVGWIKMAEMLLNPWGDDDVDFQINYLVDRNFQTTFLIADEATRDHILEPDVFQVAKIPVPAQIPDVAISAKVKVTVGGLPQDKVKNTSSNFITIPKRGHSVQASVEKNTH